MNSEITAYEGPIDNRSQPFTKYWCSMSGNMGILEGCTESPLDVFNTPVEAYVDSMERVLAGSEIISSMNENKEFNTDLQIQTFLKNTILHYKKLYPELFI